VAKLMGAYCMVNVTTSETNGKTYSNVAGLTPLPGALRNVKPQPVHELVSFDLDAPDMQVFATFHEKLQEAIKKSPEWKDMARHQPTGYDSDSDPGPSDDDVPF